MKKYGLLVIVFFVVIAGLSMKSGELEAKIMKPVNKHIFDCPQLDDSHKIVTASDCKGGTGAITGIQGTGTGNLVYTWYDSTGKAVGSQPDLTDVPAGQYRLVLKDESKCPAASLTFIIPELNPIIIDNSTTIITTPACNTANGSITNITVKNATGYQWLNSSYTVVASTKDLLNAAPGDYIFTASNTAGCFKQSKYTIGSDNLAPTLVSYSIGPADCGPSGLFHATFDMKPGDPLYQYSISDTNGKEVFAGGLAYSPQDSTRITIDAKSPPLPGLRAGTYTLATVGPSGCVMTLLKFTIEHPEYKIDVSKMVIKPNVCGKNTGTIVNIGVTGGPAPLSRLIDPNPNHGYFWKDSTGKQLSFKGNYLAGVPSAWYTVYAVNYDGCVSASARIFMPDSVSAASAPVLDDIKLCLPAKVALSVKNQDVDAHYYLYDADKNLIDSAKTGYFIHQVNETSTFYVGAVNGICVSPLGKITVKVVNPGVSFPNTFTPNNDGINDVWNITGLDQYPGTEVSVFDRTGSRVYHAINYTQPFDGRLNGANLPAGAYYYIIDTKKPGCQNGITGNITLIR
ncbi:gliding motility-associated C-terminal domain-containing protein [Mucilaginibacter boryungensis]|uniref:Gliding motility-associated C-terminal domain-containing protein n=1 Tax=Mucilaginibacter boryungensis TaxID=768480 RepID=A0ABR9XG80_9SPHI|nr:gliding motility-associated C-terminal domain-containing protein [Mucilaginibacter boryungensis]MBE9666070.1 gliding motility-associated C-terminal domain-containing protein [Mucilaginibacter boryungensis]